jgi:myosin-1
MGDYLDVNDKSALGEELAESAGIGSKCSFAYTKVTLIFKHALGDLVIFSSRVQLLVQKFGRSSKLNPRFAILVSIWFSLLVPRLNYRVI